MFNPRWRLFGDDNGKKDAAEASLQSVSIAHTKSFQRFASTRTFHVMIFCVQAENSICLHFAYMHALGYSFVHLCTQDLPETAMQTGDEELTFLRFHWA